MLFDRKPKTRREDFYNRERELELFIRGIEVGESLIVVYGVRRVGKNQLSVCRALGARHTLYSY